MGESKYKKAFYREKDGTLSVVQITLEDGEYWTRENQLLYHHSGPHELKSWSDEAVHLYRTRMGDEYYVPEAAD